jgi:small nuclear ribonucleoprotein F
MVRLKWGMQYKGFLVSVDSYMNLQVSFSPSSRFEISMYSRHNLGRVQLANTEEYQNDVSIGSLGEVLIR